MILKTNLDIIIKEKEPFYKDKKILDIIFSLSKFLGIYSYPNKQHGEVGTSAFLFLERKAVNGKNFIKFRNRSNENSNSHFSDEKLDDSFILELIEKNLYKYFWDDIKPDLGDVEKYLTKNFSFYYKEKENKLFSFT